MFPERTENKSQGEAHHKDLGQIEGNLGQDPIYTKLSSGKEVTPQKLLHAHPELVGRAGPSVQIEIQPYMPLSVENIGPGPGGLPALSVTHYGEQNGDLIRDPEMCFKMDVEANTVKQCRRVLLS